ncbi:MAG: dihydrolipoyllysine succinyltransferase [Verrucomicrobia bacterium]|nr:dihydrolipoyllysine succinyltransferase [Pseudomonadota bacterium]NBS06786.1 dihydrolipoyllysine succinyltransferase [Verrucomicrobiota bacterium]NBS79309.1 dihydrolipoyllysine succinyltransferase [bacterium]NBS50428.1 dihydrolipoyllysine succinyltransferase [Verrucomicrobiota bacterium]NBT23848.1 dihydrolipoyllysine succinyltransferase [bacterium]
MSTATATLPIRVPSVGESITSGVLGSWKRKNGDSVASGDPLFEIETDKVTSEVFAEADGTLEILIPEGTEVKVGQTVGNLHPGKATGQKGAPPEMPRKQQEKAPASKLPSRESSPAPVPTLVHTEADTAVVSHDPSRAGRETRRKMSPLRRKIADRLVSAQQTAAILTTFNEADLSNLIALRTEVQATFQAQHGVKLGFMSFFLQAAVHALQSVPALNARIEGDEIVSQHYFDIGVAVGTDRGLVVPVLRDCDQLDLAGLEKSLAAVATRAREGKLTLPDLLGGVFTISNGGVYGSVLSTPILNPPQSAILGLHAIQQRPVAVGHQVEIRPMMNLALSYDHRLIDGKEAVTFLIAIKKFVENPALALLNLNPTS